MAENSGNDSIKFEMDSQSVRIKTSDGTIFRGKINLNNETIQMDRLSDYFLKGTNPFIVLYDVTVKGGNTFFIINKAHIIWISPDDDLS